MESFRVFDFRSDPRSDVISLETSRRVSAVLHCDETAARLLLLNGGGEAELLHVDVVVPAVREPLCFGTHSVDAGKFVAVELARPTRSVRLRVRVVGGPEPIVLDERPTGLRVPVSRLAAAAVLAVGLASLTLMPGGPRRVAHHAVPASAARHVAAQPAPGRPVRLAKQTPPPAAASPEAQVAIVSAPRRLPPPPVVAVSTPQRAVYGQPIAISFKSNGQQVRIVAKIGPRTIEDRIIGASHGKVLLSPPSSASIRVLTINASVQSEGVTSVRRAIVILLPDIPAPASLTNL